MKSKLAGAGLVAGAAWAAYKRLRQPASLTGDYASASTRIVVVGGGFGGLAAARELARTLGGGVGVALLDLVNYTTFWPMVPSVISSDVEVRHVAHSIRRILRPLGVEFFQENVTGVDFEARQVQTDEGAFGYDYLILAPGSRTNFFGTPGAEENAMDAKGLRKALQVRNRVIDRFEEAERRREELPDGLLTFVFVGGGPTGVEAAADTHDLIFDVLKDDYPNVDSKQVRVVLLNAGEHILQGLEMDAPLKEDESQMQELLSEIPLRRMGKPEEVAALAVCLASDAASYVTGATFVIDGGMMRHAGSL